MDGLLKFAKEIFPLLLLYPTWAKALFVVASTIFGMSVITFVVLYSDVQKRRSDQLIASDLAINLGITTEVPQHNPDPPTDLAPDSRKEKQNEVSASLSNSGAANSQRSSMSDSAEEGEWNVKYVQAKINATTSIYPSVGYLRKLDGGGPISDVSFWWSPFHVEWPLLDLKVVNNSEKTIFFTNAVFEVQDSHLDSTPIPLIPADMGVSNAQHIYIINEGWGRMRNCVLRFNLISKANADVTDFEEPFTNETPINDIADAVNVDVSNAFAKAGVNNAAIRGLQFTQMSGNSITVVGNNNQPRILSREEFRDERLKALDPFPNNVALAVGEMLYSNEDNVQKNVKFSTSVHVMNQNIPGAPAPPTAQYDVMLKVDGSNYVVNIPISQAIKKGEFDRFTFRVASPKSSIHDLRLKLIYNDGEIYSSTPIKLVIFLPKSISRYYLR
jgi:hypothetical protein